MERNTDERETSLISRLLRAPHRGQNPQPGPVPGQERNRCLSVSGFTLSRCDTCAGHGPRYTPGRLCAPGIAGDV